MEETSTNEEKVKVENESVDQNPVVPMPAMIPGGMPVMMRPTFPFPGMNPAMRQFGEAHSNLLGINEDNRL